MGLLVAGTEGGMDGGLVSEEGLTQERRGAEQELESKSSMLDFQTLQLAGKHSSPFLVLTNKYQQLFFFHLLTNKRPL